MGILLQIRRRRPTGARSRLFCCAGLLVSALGALAGGGVPIEFSAPRSDAVISNMFESRRSSSSVLEQLEDDIFSPLFKQDSQGSLGPVINLPNRRPATPSPRVREWQEQERNWLFMDPDQYLRRASGADKDKDPSMTDETGIDESRLSVYERYFLQKRQRESEAAAEAQADASASEAQPFIPGLIEPAVADDFDPILNSVNHDFNPLSPFNPLNPLNPLVKDFLPQDRERNVANPFGTANLNDPDRLGGAFSANLVGDPVQRERLESFQQLLRPEQALTSAQDPFQNLLKNPSSLTSRPGADGLPGQTLSMPNLNPRTGIENSSLPSLQQNLNGFNSAFETPDPFRSRHLQDPTVTAFGQSQLQSQRERESSFETRPRVSPAPLVLPRPTRDF